MYFIFVFTVSHRFVEPFCTDAEPIKALSSKPDNMSEEEIMEFAGIHRFPTMYLSIRNILISLWNLNSKVKCVL